MKSNELEIQNNLRVNYGKKSHKVYRGNRPLLCGDCIRKHDYPIKTKKEQYETAKHGVQFIYDEKSNMLECPSCNRKIEVLKTYADYLKEEELKQKKERENVHLEFYDKSWSSGLEYYRLSTKLEPERWDNVKRYFTYIKYDIDDDEQDTMYGNKLYGWLTTNPLEVEKRLNVKEELTIQYRKEMNMLEEKRHRESILRKNRLKDTITKCFHEYGEYPSDVSLETIKGLRFEPSSERWDAYGNGTLFIISDDWIWYIRNNGADGDDWARNNVKTHGAGAIGMRLVNNDELEGMIKEYCQL